MLRTLVWLFFVDYVRICQNLFKDCSFLFVVIDRVSKFGECVKYDNYLPYKALKNRRAWYNLELGRDKFFESNERSEYS